MLDYLFCAPSPAAAIADPALGAFYMPASAGVSGGWRGDVVNAGLQVWNAAQDATSTVTDPQTGQTETVVTHTYLPGFWISVSASARNPALEASPYLILGADRDAANAGAPATTYIFAFGPNQSLTTLANCHVSPLMAGAAYPFGAST